MIVKWILRLVVNIVLMILFSTILTYGIGYAFDAEFSTSTMVLGMGAVLILPYIIGLNILALISTIFCKRRLDENNSGLFSSTILFCVDYNEHQCCLDTINPIHNTFYYKYDMDFSNEKNCSQSINAIAGICKTVP